MVELTDHQRHELDRLMNTGRESARKITRARLDFAHLVRDLLDGPYRYATQVVLVIDKPEHARYGQPVRRVPAGRGPAAGRPAGDPPHAEARVVAQRGQVDLAALGKRLPDRLDDVATLTRHAAVEADRNEAKKGCRWQFTTADARIKLVS